MEAVSIGGHNAELDKELFLTIRKILSEKDVMQFIKDNNFAGFSFSRSKLDPLVSFCYECDKPEFEFLDVDLEGRKSELFNKASRFLGVIATTTFVVDKEFSSVPQEWEDEQPERFWRVVNEIHGLAEEIGNSYCEFIGWGEESLGFFKVLFTFSSPQPHFSLRMK